MQRTASASQRSDPASTTRDPGRSDPSPRPSSRARRAATARSELEAASPRRRPTWRRSAGTGGHGRRVSRTPSTRVLTRLDASASCVAHRPGRTRPAVTSMSRSATWPAASFGSAIPAIAALSVQSDERRDEQLDAELVGHRRRAARGTGVGRDAAADSQPLQPGSRRGPGGSWRPGRRRPPPGSSRPGRRSPRLVEPDVAPTARSGRWSA